MIIVLKSERDRKEPLDAACMRLIVNTCDCFVVGKFLSKVKVIIAKEPEHHHQL
jgi:hypothetical protein